MLLKAENYRSFFGTYTPTKVNINNLFTKNAGKTLDTGSKKVYIISGKISTRET